MRVGVLGLQGGVAEHLAMLRPIEGVVAGSFMRVSELERLDAVILPGGESTAMGKLLAEFGLLEPLAARIAGGLPVWGTCAGLILLAKDISNDQRHHLAVMDITVDRNAYGRQLHSFIGAELIAGLPGGPFPLVFIRAPRITRLGPGVQALAKVAGEPVACRQVNMVATAFHPELSGDDRFHRWFVELARTAQTGIASRKP
ncbi:MAG: glutamine amidotransferase subunit PdxT [Spirochaetes bacterium GWD1_61_31]|nr:MAG: glutamine amidotransferase subunit PdxT [Spirochaetes bacterium GWB1_60_80]OHD32954.1 MAG: glutamine amidotransferase subunit PdxT [Spirochaetes bacterium GWC1_61_12]OHD38695.1 MAG: glutamine amidotransferase subunit PdxT [Spirochaetes bacterium GWD1_61_31]OHD43259.1 MAG: glutamine amidotransferase subunit PdxT [Spirochaetes bacterium GWE1_60_18]OHD58819.1 MAG: glutamine amidotransferase subunit PdxT [Spirochaetes bacterium GWF1_60_12]HAP42680.1 pyridoxal 5'-phosphate synthase glutamin